MHVSISTSLPDLPNTIQKLIQEYGPAINAITITKEINISQKTIKYNLNGFIDQNIYNQISNNNNEQKNDIPEDYQNLQDILSNLLTNQNIHDNIQKVLVTIRDFTNNVILEARSNNINIPDHEIAIIVLSYILADLLKGLRTIFKDDVVEKALERARILSLLA